MEELHAVIHGFYPRLVTLDETDVVAVQINDTEIIRTDSGTEKEGNEVIEAIKLGKVTRPAIKEVTLTWNVLF
jgi:hypothetical protein